MRRSPRQGARPLLGAALALAFLAGLALTPVAGAAPSARIAGKLQVGETVRVVTTGGTASAIRWQRCRTKVVRNRCARSVRVGAGRTHRIGKASAGRSLRAVVVIKRKRVVTRWSAPVKPAPAGTPTTPPPASAPLQIPAGWRVTGSADTVPLDPALTPAERDARLRELSSTYARIDALIRNRGLAHTEVDAEGTTKVRLDLCAPRYTFIQVIERQTPAGGWRLELDGEWSVSVDLTGPSLAPILHLAPAEDQPSSLPMALDPADLSRVIIGDYTRTSVPSAACAAL